jgi:hypothetical protein
MQNTVINTRPATSPIDNTDWLKTVAITLVVIDHFGYFFIEYNQWWSVVGRLAAPVFFFLLGFAKTRKVPFSWIWLGVGLTMLDSWNNDWTWVAPNILLSLALVRLARPYIESLLQHQGWIAFTVLVIALITVLPITAGIVEYGSEGWLWALFGLCQRMYIDSRPVTAQSPSSLATNLNSGLMRLLAGLVASVVCVWQEQLEYSFSDVQVGILILAISGLSIWLGWFLRGPSHIQMPQPFTGALQFLGRHTLEIYAIQLAGFEIIINLLPDLAP